MVDVNHLSIFILVQYGMASVPFMSLTVCVVKCGGLVPFDADGVGPCGCIGVVRALYT